MNSIPRLRFANLPTPIEPLPRLSAALQAEGAAAPRLFVKRDDLTGLALGGNKTRKLEYLLAEAQANGARTLITAGAAQSNHCRQTAAAAARFGMACILVLVGTADEDVSGNLLLDQLLGAQFVWCSRAERDATLKGVFNDAWTAGKRPYLIPYGGSSPTGATGYVQAFQELVEQEFLPDWIVFPSSSGGTQAGLAVGARLHHFAGKVLGISIDEPETVLTTRLADLATRTADGLGESLHFTPEDFSVNCDYLGGGYGVMGPLEQDAVRLFARHEGLLLDPVYTGRAGGGMIDLIRKGFFKPTDAVLFWHTGGTPALFAAKYRNLTDSA
jgi:D-cysteine desulfhydrase family pyridoxal phosphate-dependent enzyme